MKKKLDLILKETLEKCFNKGVLEKTALPDYVIEIPNNTNHGHFATNLALALASSQRRPPREIAEIIVEHLVDTGDLLEGVEIAGPGFLNFTISREEWYRLLLEIASPEKDFGRSDQGAGKKILVEFVSANPTGPLHLGHGRGAALGDTLCRILEFTGYDVAREFYINDAGQQMRLLGESIYSRWRQLTEPEYPFPENGYHGDYILDLVKEISRSVDLKSLPEEEAISRCSELGKHTMLEEIKKDLEEFRVIFDVWSSESALYASGSVEEALEAIKEKGQLYEKDGALWIRTSLYGDDKDRVVRKKDGQYTYFASDIAYHLEKWKRGFSKAVNIWGADHHGYVQRMKAALKANGLDDSWLSVLLIQLVKLWKGGQEIKMSKRAGHYVTLKELVGEVGVDAVRFVFLTKNHDSQLDFDVDMVKRQDSENPVYYVQYAHARICSIFRKAASEGISLPDRPQEVLKELNLEEEMALVRLMAEFPPLLEDIARRLEPHRLTYYLTELASGFHKYFNLGTKEPDKRIVTDNVSRSQARLILAEAVRKVLVNGLCLLGISAPERM
ncbi:MAG: arginine--tRNA ligase [Deltaproteobacteria bacterium]|nr:arginine--tRNA ligase [Deltaproteobacteria bacterium]MBW1918907.1 arginine--tRNA ligase [Deltaproteobacteria bacterium]MBW1934721.1 arginine--tRNA ligase [Deltaproteobacteria bacterium]